MQTLISRLVLKDQWLSQVHESNTQVFRHLKPVAAFLKSATSSCWAEVGLLFAGVDLCGRAVCVLSQHLGAVGALQQAGAVSVT